MSETVSKLPPGRPSALVRVDDDTAANALFDVTPSAATREDGRRAIQLLARQGFYLAMVQP